MRVVLVDDDPQSRRHLRELLAACEYVVVVGEARYGSEAVRIAGTTAPDLLVIDVQIPEFDGFEVLRRLRPPLPIVIFVTAYHACAVRAFETHALDYLVKPIHQKRFAAAIERAREHIRSSRVLDASRRLIELLEQRGDLVLGPEPMRRLVVPQTGGELLLDVADIRWIEADDYYAAVHASGKRHLVRESLESLERRLDPTQFVRVHRSAIVSLARVREVRRDSPAVVVLTDGTTIPLSRRRRVHVADAMHRFAGRRR